MAKGNLFQGMARGKVGDVVFSRANGQQVSRVRNRQPNNPRTNAQLYQRAIMATIMQAYSAGKEIFDHSFQGYKVGADNQNRFMTINTKKLRAAVASDVANGLTGGGCTARVIGPGVKYPVPWTYQISEGSLPQDIMDSCGGLKHIGEVQNETVAQYVRRMGIQQNDIFTVVAFNCATNSSAFDVVFTAGQGGDEYAEQTKCIFLFARLRVKASAYNDATVISSITTMDHIFEYDLSSNYTPSLNVHQMGAGILYPDEMPQSETLYTAGVIRSRDNEDLRSTCVMEWPFNEASEYGLTTDYLQTAWAEGTAKIGESNLILEGGRVQRAAANSSSQVAVASRTGVAATIYSLVETEVNGTHESKIVKLVATDGSEFGLYGNGTKVMAYTNYLAKKNGSFIWDTLANGTTIPDAETVDYFADENDVAPIGSLLEFLLRMGVPANIATGVATGRE